AGRARRQSQLEAPLVTGPQRLGSERGERPAGGMGDDAQLAVGNSGPGGTGEAAGEQRLGSEGNREGVAAAAAAAQSREQPRLLPRQARWRHLADRHLGAVGAQPGGGAVSGG